MVVEDKLERQAQATRELTSVRRPREVLAVTSVTPSWPLFSGLSALTLQA